MPTGPGSRLTGWKEIAAFLACSVRTAQRWEATYGLPVRRLAGTRGGMVIAFADELTSWMASERGRAARDEDAEAPAPPRDAVPARRGRASVRATRWVARLGLAAIPVGLLALRASTGPGLAAPLECPSPCVVRQGGTLLLTMTGADPGDTYTRWTRTGPGRVHAFGPPLTPDASGFVTWGFTTDCSTPTGTHELRLLSGRSGLGTAAVSLRVEPAAACSEPVADLVAEGVEIDRAAASAGDRLVCRFRIRNQGRTRAPASVARLRLSRSPDRSAVTDLRIADVMTPDLPVGSEAALSLEFRLPDALTPGADYFVWVVADNGSAVIERVAWNNFARSPALLVQPRIPPNR